ncbi:hypothetical protein Cgig2_032222 [Carnegiea gigantea]|uniref:DNA-directed RNA polymerase subunit n=1 Tax=Carnegiea gigantea TaxID=171969 RepID=A0A9Q1GPX7_9CARY|nr:hypothetical protein Cgig2_032222 [Carnegiea gigantea]
MEVWALEGFGVAHILQEMLTYKSDHIKARQEVFNTMIFGGTIPKPEVIGDEKEDKRFCEQCGVEFVNSRVRMYQMGYIKLACPVTHVWYLKRLSSYIAIFLNKPLKELEGLVYYDFSFAKPIVKNPTFLRLRGLFENENQSWKYRSPLFFTIQSAIRELLADLDLRTIIDYSFAKWKELGEKEPTGNEWEDRKVGRRKEFLVRRMELAKHFVRTNIEPEWMVLCLLPVLPLEFRPIIQIDGGKFISSNINKLYRRVIIRNNILTGLLTSGFTPKDVVASQEKFLQEATDTLLDNGIHGQPMRDGHNKVYKSFSDVIEGKEGRFRETVLGKRVNYSGHSVIVIGPSLSLHQCGLPREIAIELFQIFIMRDLIRQHLASDIGVTKSQIQDKGPVVWKILQEVMQGHPVLLSRAPTLHRLGILAFQPILVEGHDLFTSINFNGDQMAVHVPLSLEAQAEARLLMFSHMNLLSLVIGDPIFVPTQDMLIGLYVLTSGNRLGICANRYNPRNHKTIKIKELTIIIISIQKKPFLVIAMMQLGLIWRLDQCVIASREAPIEVHYESLCNHHEIYGHYLIKLYKDFIEPAHMVLNHIVPKLSNSVIPVQFESFGLINRFGMAYTSHILDQVKTLGFRQATAASISLGIDDLFTISSKGWLVQDAEQQSLILQKHHHYENVHAVEK